MHTILSDILYISRCHGSHQRQRAQDTPLTPMQISLVSRICREEGIAPEKLCKDYAMDKSRLAHHMNDLESAGYITRCVSPEDGRKRMLYPTQKAKTLYPKIHESHFAFAERLLEGMTEEEIEVLTQATQIMRKNAQQMLEEDKL